MCCLYELLVGSRIYIVRFLIETAHYILCNCPIWCIFVMEFSQINRSLVDPGEKPKTAQNYPMAQLWKVHH